MNIFSQEKRMLKVPQLWPIRRCHVKRKDVRGFFLMLVVLFLFYDKLTLSKSFLNQNFQYHNFQRHIFVSMRGFYSRVPLEGRFLKFIKNAYLSFSDS